jgi:hypothetical protein
MSIVRMTSADVLALNSSEAIIGLIRQGQKKFPEFEMFPASAVEKTSYKTLVRTALPSVGFRAINAGRETQKPTLAARSVDCMFLDASWDIDEAAALACEWGLDRALEIQAQAHIDAMMKAICSQIWYGTGADAAGFAGVAGLLDNTDDAMVVDATGTTASTGSSLFAVRFGVDACQLAWGLNGKIMAGEIARSRIFDGDGKAFWGWAQAVSGYAGLQLTNYEACGRICNLTADSGKGLTDDLIADLLAKFPVGEKPDAMFCSRRSLRQLQNSRTATNPTGAPAPFPDSAFGVPLHPSDSILDTETLLVAAGS